MVAINFLQKIFNFLLCLIFHFLLEYSEFILFPPKDFTAIAHPAELWYDVLKGSFMRKGG